MLLKRSIRPFPLALVLGAGLASPALAQNDAPVRSLDSWSYDNLYRSGWSAERMMDEAEVIGANGEEIGDIENIILNQQGRILGIIAEVGGFWDIGDTHVFVPWSQVRIGPDLDRIAVPVTEDNVEDYSSFSDNRLTRTATGRTQVVADDLATGRGVWKATDLIDDRAYLSDHRSYGYVNDLIFSSDGTLQALVINAAPAWGAGYRAFPFYGYGYGWNPGLPSYNMGYDGTDVERLGRFDYSRLPDTVRTQSQEMAASGSSETDARTNVTGALSTRWTFRDIDADGDLELTSREFLPLGTAVYGRWDTNGDSRLDEGEFYSGLFDVFDADGDRQVTENEFSSGWQNWGASGMSPSYGSLDTDGDGTIDRNEFRAGFDQLGYWNRWDSDRDGQLGRDEFNTGLYDVWDADSDGAIAQNEFGNLVERNWL